MKKTALIALAALMAAPLAQARDSRAKADDVILHAWSWSFDTIAANMKNIAEAGFTMVQTSPANTCYVGEEGGMALFGTPENGKKGKWYYHYQPTDWQIGNYQLGTREQFRALGDSALKYNVRLLVDVLPNHVAFDHKAVRPGLDNAVGGHDKLLHANGLTGITDYNDRYQCTLQGTGGLPDVNTENPDFQHYFMQYLNDLINLGARGFRYDTAKHIGLPSDPVDATATENNFWPIFTHNGTVKGLGILMPDSLYIYGEVLQDRNVKEMEYDEYIDQTASSYGHVLREALANANALEADLAGWRHPVDPTHLVTWVESHDTYANEHESAGLTDDQIRAAWVFLVSRAEGTPLFFSRPAGSTRDNYWGHNRIGERGNDEFMHPQVKAANAFRRAMAGQPESIAYAAKGAVAVVNRGSAGAALVNFSQKEQKVEVATELPDGTYTDELSGAKFTVKNGTLKGKLAPLGSALLLARI